MVVIATGFVEIDANVLKEQQEKDITSAQSNQPHEKIVIAQTCDKKLSFQQPQQALKKSEVAPFLEQQQQSQFSDSENMSSVNDLLVENYTNQEELDAIANIKQPFQSIFVEKEVTENETKHLEGQPFSAATNNKSEKNTSTLQEVFDDDSAIQEELDAIANIQLTIGLKNECDKVLKNESIIVEKIVTERKRKPSEDEAFSTSTQNEFDKKEDIQEVTHEEQSSKLQDPATLVCASTSKKSKLTPSTTQISSERIIENKEKV